MKQENKKEPFIVMYHGGVMPGRGIEMIIRLLVINSDICAIILGDGDVRYLDLLKKMADENKVEERLLFHPAVPHKELWKYVGVADVGMVMIQDVSKSYYLSLPNKLFENIQALTPVIASDFPEIGRVVNEYGIGVLCNPADLDSINNAVKKMMADTVVYKQMKADLLRAKNELCWEQERKRLSQAYKLYLGNEEEISHMKYVKYMPSHSIIHASRNKREILIALDEGFCVCVFSDDEKISENVVSENIEFIYDGKCTLTYSMPRWKRYIGIIYNYFVVFFRTCKLQGDVWSCHDLSSLKMAWFATRFRICKPKLIYDSHEFELGRNVKRTRLQKWSIKQWERFLMKRCVFSIMVNDSIADEVQQIHKLKERPIVVRSTPNNWQIDSEACKKVREEFINYFTQCGERLSERERLL